MKRCPYALLAMTDYGMIYIRCVRRHLIKGSGLHMAKPPIEGLAFTHENAYICWRSSNGPDHHVEHLSWSAEIVE